MSDLDPNEVLENEHDPDTDVDTDPVNDQAGEEGEPVDGAQPVDDSFEVAE